MAVKISIPISTALTFLQNIIFSFTTLLLLLPPPRKNGISLVTCIGLPDHKALSFEKTPYIPRFCKNLCI